MHMQNIGAHRAQQRPLLSRCSIVGLCLLNVVLDAEAEPVSMRGSEKANQRIGLHRRPPKARSSLLQTKNGAVVNDPLTPQANDTVSPMYWSKVNKALAEAQDAHEARASLNDPAPAPEDEPWTKILKASQIVQIVDTPQDLAHHTSWEYATPMPGTGATAGTPREIGVVPYDMEIGAHIMYSLSEKNTQSPPPTQQIVDQQFVSQCPMIMFGAGLRVMGPRCGDHMGMWADPATERPVLRWKSTSEGGVYFGVDSAVGGEGGAYFGAFKEKMTLNRYEFELSNCLKVMRYIVEEQVIKMDHIAPGAHSTNLAHDVGRTKEAFFYKYTIRHPNGTNVAATNLYRLDQNEVNFTMLKDDIPAGVVYASARRSGRWTRDSWRECTGTKRGWDMSFPSDSASFATVATVQDLRVAAAATLTLMSLRDEQVGYDGFQHTGQSSLYWSLMKTILLIFFLALGMAVATILIQRKGWDKKMKRFLFRFEAFLFPRRPVRTRVPVLNPTY